MRFASLLLLAVGAVVAGAYYSKNRTTPKQPSEKLNAKPEEKDWSEPDFDERMDESFPASDPPSWSSHNLH